MDILEIETRRNEWVAKALAVDGGVYRDDNAFISNATGEAVGLFIKDADGLQYLVDHNWEGDVAVPYEHLLDL